MSEDNFYKWGQFFYLKAIFMTKNNFYGSLQQNIYFERLNINLKNIWDVDMNYTLFDQFEKFISGNIGECFSPICLLPFLCLEYNYNSNKMINVLNEDYTLKNINFINSNKIIDDLYLESKVKNQNAFKFILHEIIDNIHEHSKFSKAYVMSKSYANIVDYCFLDNGITIQKSFENNNFYFENDCDAILKAINGKSTKQVSGFIERGYGFNNIVSLLTLNNNGSVLIASRKGIVYIDKNKIYKRELSKNCINGCIVGLRFELSQDFNNFYSLIDGHHIFEA